MNINKLILNGLTGNLSIFGLYYFSKNRQAKNTKIIQAKTRRLYKKDTGYK